ncbi:hypothetical protein Lal_00030319 [Lupinus albus]|nr:hypothetical protein Lal_00030319 [Lupinus albus]
MSVTTTSSKPSKKANKTAIKETLLTQRNNEFKEAADKLDGPPRQIFVEFLERSCTAEFSGFLLYKD